MCQWCSVVKHPWNRQRGFSGLWPIWFLFFCQVRASVTGDRKRVFSTSTPSPYGLCNFGKSNSPLTQKTKCFPNFCVHFFIGSGLALACLLSVALGDCPRFLSLIWCHCSSSSPSGLGRDGRQILSLPRPKNIYNMKLLSWFDEPVLIEVF